MNFLKSIFVIPQNASAVITWFLIITGFFAIVFTLSVAIPQLVFVIRNKTVDKETKYYSFWLFYGGIIGWIIIGAFGGSDTNPKMTASVYANVVCSLIYSFLLYYIYKFSPSKKRQFKAIYVFVFTFLLNIIILILSIIGIIYKWYMPETLLTVSMQIIPMVTTFAFLPQILKNFETKNYLSLSLGMILLFVLTNVAWILYWIVLIAATDKSQINPIISALVWQSLSLGIYLTQYIMTIKSRKKGNRPQKIKVWDETYV